MKKGPFKMKTFSGFGNESPVKHNKAAEEIGMFRPDGKQNFYNTFTGEYSDPSKVEFAVGMSGNKPIKTTASIGKPRKRRNANPTGAKIF